MWHNKGKYKIRKYKIKIILAEEQIAEELQFALLCSGVWIDL